MSRLDELIAEFCPDGVEFVELNEVLDYEQPTKYIVKSTNYDDSYTIPVLTAGQSFVLGYTNEDFGIYKASPDSPVIIFDDFTTSFHWVDFNFKVKSSAMKMLRSKDNEIANLRFLFHLMKNINYIPVDHSRQWIGKYSKFRIPLPPLPVQQEIVRILDNFTGLTALTAELTAELTARRKQYEYYRDLLLTFGDSVEYKPLGVVCDYVDYRGKTPRKVDVGIFLITAKNIRKGFIDYNISREYIAVEDYEQVMKRGKPNVGDVLITTEAPCGNVAQLDRDDIALAQRVIKYRGKKGVINNSYLKYVLLGTEFQMKLLRAATGGTVKGIKGSILHKLTIPVPPIEEQERIVAILDRFDALCNDLTSGIPAEIEARQKQYEYYRDKLLSFKEVTA
jgi:type I restriction enzyme S subunit